MIVVKKNKWLSTRSGSRPNLSSVERNLCLTLSQQNNLHLSTRREFGNAYSIFGHTCSTLGAI